MTEVISEVEVENRPLTEEEITGLADKYIAATRAFLRSQNPDTAFPTKEQRDGAAVDRRGPRSYRAFLRESVTGGKVRPVEVTLTEGETYRETDHRILHDETVIAIMHPQEVRFPKVREFKNSFPQISVVSTRVSGERPQHASLSFIPAGTSGAEGDTRVQVTDTETLRQFESHPVTQYISSPPAASPATG